ncbi:hypothetical protein BC833DRAFT_606500 [Globomyces pollinis-pini]|nr:hypothetical protein BC833DRAFT_606500 [Globomyces pollinis-pini]
MGNSEIEKPSRNKNKKTNVDNKKLDKERRKKKSTSLGFHPTSIEYPKRDFQLALLENICVCDYLEFVELEDSDFWLTLIRKKYPNFQYGPVHLKFLNTFVKRYNLTTFPLHYGLQNITKITKRKTKPLEHHYLPKIYHDFFIESFYDQFIKYSDDWKYYSVTEMERMMARGCSTIPYINDRLLLKWTLGSGIVLIRWLDMIHKIYPGYESMVTREFLELVKEGVYRYLFTCTSSLEIFMDTCIKVIANQPVELFIPEILHSHFSKWFTISCFSLKNMNQSHLYIQNPLEMNYNSTHRILQVRFYILILLVIDQRAILDTSSVTLHDSSVTTHSIEMDMFGTNIQPPEIDIHTNDLIPQEPNLIFPSLS